MDVTEAFCRGLQRAHGVKLGQSWGSLDGAQIAEWMERRCDRFFCRPSPMEGKGKYKCVPL